MNLDILPTSKYTVFMNTRDQIMIETDALIQNKGFKGFSYADLSQRLGVTKASIHHHFPSKEDLGIAYCKDKISALSRFRKHLSGLPNAMDKFKAYLSIFEGCANGQMCGINAMQSDIEDMSNGLKDMVRVVTELELEILTEILTEGRALHELHFKIAPYDQAVVISSAVKGALLLGRVKKEKYFERLCNVLITSLE